MKNAWIADGLSHIDDRYISEAAAKNWRKRLPWLGAIAAVLALVLLFHVGNPSLTIRAQAVALAADSRKANRPDYKDYVNQDDWILANEAWTASRDQRSTVVHTALARLQPFFCSSCETFLTGEGNLLYSPVNAYLGLAMAAELTAGNTQSQLLNLLQAENTDALRAQASALWETVHQNEGGEISALANALWLDDEAQFLQSPMDILSYHYYGDIYRQDLQSSAAVRDISAWLNDHTGGFLKRQTGSISLPPEAVMVLYSTIYFRSKWSDEFSASRNTTDMFHTPDGDVTCTYMNKDLYKTNYYWGSSFGAVGLHLKNGSTMWFILPDGDKTVSDVLAEGQYLEMITDAGNWENHKYMKVNLSVPKFDVTAQTKLRQGLEDLGVTDLFQIETADFSPSFSQPVFITAANQTIRVAIDEQGVTAAAYLELPAASEPMPPEEIIDFVVDRPFLFCISHSGIPLFAGSVSHP